MLNLCESLQAGNSSEVSTPKNQQALISGLHLLQNYLQTSNMAIQLMDELKQQLADGPDKQELIDKISTLNFSDAEKSLEKIIDEINYASAR